MEGWRDGEKMTWYTWLKKRGDKNKRKRKRGRVKMRRGQEEDAIKREIDG